MSNAIHEIRERLEKEGLDILRIMFADVLGTTRSKYVLTSELERGVKHGPAFCQGVWVTTNRGDVLDAENIVSDGLQDFITKLNPKTIKNLSYESGMACVIVDAYNPDLSENLFAPRTILKRIIAQYAKIGLIPVVGPELEFYIAKCVNG
ncbi:MAG: glutamine synthetase, partial [Actinobacteria bacterium]|nr:glutamine synthetase [Actinomycetota bacterium]